MKKVRTPGSVTASGTTKALIIEKANIIINEIGMTEFRINLLAKSLGLSPGNITYHFPQKEDLAIELWHRYNAEIRSLINTYVTPLLDIKQIFLMFKNSYMVCYKYRGIIAYRQGDIGIINRECWDMSESVEHTDKINLQLCANGYIEKNLIKGFELIAIESHYTHFGWALSAIPTSDEVNIEELSDKYALEIIFQLSPFMTELGTAQLKSIAQHVLNTKR